MVYRYIGALAISLVLPQTTSTDTSYSIVLLDAGSHYSAHSTLAFKDTATILACRNTTELYEMIDPG